MPHLRVHAQDRRRRLHSASVARQRERDEAQADVRRLDAYADRVAFMQREAAALNKSSLHRSAAVE